MISKIEVTDYEFMSRIPSAQAVVGIAIVIFGLLAIVSFFAV